MLLSDAIRRGSAATARFPTETIYRGTRLYHGTNVAEPFEEDGVGTPDGPAWFSNARSAASYFALDYHQSRGGTARVLVYEVTRAIPKIASVRSKESFDRLLAMIGLDPELVEAGMEEIRDAMATQKRINGWNIHDNSQPGDDILLVSPENYLRFLRVDPA